MYSWDRLTVFQRSLVNFVREYRLESIRDVVEGIQKNKLPPYYQHLKLYPPYVIVANLKFLHSAGLVWRYERVKQRV